MGTLGTKTAIPSLHSEMERLCIPGVVLYLRKSGSVKSGHERHSPRPSASTSLMDEGAANGVECACGQAGDNGLVMSSEQGQEKQAARWPACQSPPPVAVGCTGPAGP